MTTSVEITTRFADYTTRKVTIPKVQSAELDDLRVKLLSFELETLNGIYVGKDGVSNPTEFEAAKIITTNDVVVWTREGGLVQ